MMSGDVVTRDDLNWIVRTFCTMAGGWRCTIIPRELKLVTFLCRYFFLAEYLHNSILFFYCLYIHFIRSSQLVIYRIQSTPSKSSVEWNKEEFTARSAKVGHRQQGHSNALLPDKNMRANKTENKHGEIPLLRLSKQPSQTKANNKSEERKVKGERRK